MSEYADQGTAGHMVLESCLVSIYSWGIEMLAADYINQEIRVEDGPHAPLSPSGAKQWATCLASVFMAQRYPGPAQGPRCIVFDADYAAAVQTVLDYVATRVEEIQKMTGEPVEVLAERRVSLDPLLPTHENAVEFDGTVDITLRSGNFVEIIDFKSGVGVPVEVDDPQLEQYLVGTVAENILPDDTSLEKARLTVIQPRCEKISPKIRWREVEVRPLVASVIDVCTRVLTEYRNLNAGLGPDDADLTPHFGPSDDACRFCVVGGGAKYSGASVCEHYARHAMIRAGVFPEDAETLPDSAEVIFDAAEAFAARDTHTLTPKQLIGILFAREILSGALQAAEAWALSMLEEGTAPEALEVAFKLVAGRANRCYLGSEEETFKALKRIKVQIDGKTRALGKKDVYEARLKSPAQVEKILRGAGIPSNDIRFKAFERLIEKPRGSLTIAPMSDPRPAAQPRRQEAAAIFQENEAPDAPALP